MPKGCVIFTETIRDQAGLDAYAQKALPTLMQGGGKLIILQEDPEVLEGEWPGSRTVVLEFESVEAARKRYTSPEYQAALPLQQAAADSSAVIVSGFEMPTS